MTNPYAYAAVKGVEALSSYAKMKAQKQAFKQQEKLALYNATLSDNQARQAIEDGTNAVTDYQRNVSAFKSSQINALAENGIDVTQGSAIDLLASTEMLAQGDIDSIKYNAALQSWGHKVQATNYRNQAENYRVAAKSIRPLTSTLLSLGGEAASALGSGMGKGGLGGGIESGSASSGGSDFASSLYDIGGSNSQGASWQNYNWNWFGAS
ncbi:virion core protein, T7 gp14 family [Acinetobacter baumannii]|uniref:virion core protein, T7 gp14 family n=1 Tax=Acinetobacter baumannii TaxID=470 RepID=UPI0033906A9F